MARKSKRESDDRRFDDREYRRDPYYRDDYRRQSRGNYRSEENRGYQVVEEVRKNFQDMVFKTLINRNTKLAEAPGFGQPAILYDANSRGSEDYMLLAQELIKRNLE